MSDLQLSYSFRTRPGVLQAGNEGRLTIIVSNAKAPFTLSGIDLVLTEGAGARDIAGGVPPTTYSMPDGWTHPDPTGGKFSMAPPAPYPIGREGLAFVFDVTVSTVVGTALIDVTEHILVDGAPRANRGTLAVPKFPQTFSLDAFYSATPIINQGDSVTLAWTGENLNLANYSLSYSAGGQTRLVSIPAHTFIYTVDALDASGVFYLHVQAAESPDTSVTFQSTEYPITVNPAIAAFWADESVAAPGASVVLHWQVAANVASAILVCPQSGATRTLDAAALTLGQLTVSLPAIAMTAQYLLQAFDAGQGGAAPALLAAADLAVEVTPNIPFQQSGYGQFFTDAQAGDVAAMRPVRPLDDTVVPALFDAIFAAFRTVYPDIDFYLDWSNPAANARSFQYIDGRKKVVIYGGLVRVSCLYYEAFCFIVAQCVARFSGQAPVDANQLTYVGVADFQATPALLMRVFYTVSANSDLVNGIFNQLRTLFLTGISAANQQPDPANPAANPGIQCRFGAIAASIFGQSMPGCTTGTA